MTRERGSATLLATAGLFLLVVLAAGAADAGRLAVARAAAQTAADAAALAAAPVSLRADGSPREEAARFARSNGAHLVRCRCPVDTRWRARTMSVEVAVDLPEGILGVSTVTARAVAELDPAAWTVPSGRDGIIPSP